MVPAKSRHSCTVREVQAVWKPNTVFTLLLIKSFITYAASKSHTLFGPQHCTFSNNLQFHKSAPHSSGRLLVIAPALPSKLLKSRREGEKKRCQLLIYPFTTSEKCWKYICQNTNVRRSCRTSALWKELFHSGPISTDSCACSDQEFITFLTPHQMWGN